MLVGGDLVVGGQGGLRVHDEAALRRRPAHVEGHAVAPPGQPADVGGGHDPPCGARLDGAHGLDLGVVGGHQPPVGLHDHQLADPDPC